MAKYENCASCNTTIDMNSRDNWKQCADCQSIFCPDCMSKLCPICKKFADNIYDSGKFRVPKF